MPNLRLFAVSLEDQDEKIYVVPGGITSQKCFSYLENRVDAGRSGMRVEEFSNLHFTSQSREEFNKRDWRFVLLKLSNYLKSNDFIKPSISIKDFYVIRKETSLNF